SGSGGRCTPRDQSRVCSSHGHHGAPRRARARIQAVGRIDDYGGRVGAGERLGWNLDGSALAARGGSGPTGRAVRRRYPGAGPFTDRSPDLLRELDDDPLGATDVAEPVAVLVLLQLADEFGSVGPQATEDIVDALDREAEVADARRVRGGARVAARTRRRLVGDQL